jgi:hypothetical protein
MIKTTVRQVLRGLLGRLERYPALRRFLVDVAYRFPALDARLRTAAHRVIHIEAALDVDADRLPDSSRRSYERMRTERAP